MTALNFMIGLIFLSLCANAQASEVKITSFKYTGTKTRTAELCGRIEGEFGALAIIDVISDPSFKYPGQYSSIAAQDGKFCIVINTLSGEASANVRGQSQKATAEIK